LKPIRMNPLVLLLAIAAPVGGAQQPLVDPPTASPAAAVNANPAIAGGEFGGSMASRGLGGGRNQLVSLSIPAIGDAPFSLTLLTTWKMPSNGPVRQVNDNPFYNSRRIVRDSAGRIYQERWSMARDLPNLPDVTNMNEPKPQMMSIEISDPVAHVSYDCSVAEKACRETDYRLLSVAYSGSEANQHDGGVETSKSIGARTIEGIKTEGYQVTTTYTSGASGVTRADSEVREFWYAPRLGIDLIAEVKSPAIGHQTFLVRDLKTAEPDAQYFRVPAGYRVIDERRQAAPGTAGTTRQAGGLKTRDAQPAEATSTPLPSSPVPPAVTTLQATARIVELDVVAVDAHGQPVKGLKASDFVLSEDGGPQTLQSFTERDAAADQPPPPALPAFPPNTFANHAPLLNDTAMTALLFDTSQISFSDAAYVRDEVAAYLKKVKPGTPMCVFDLDQWDGLQLIQDFTTDTAILRKAVESKRNEQKPVIPFFTPPLQRGIATRQLAHYLAGFPGRKNLIWFYGPLPPEIAVGSGLYPDTTTMSEGDFANDLSGMTEALTLNRVALYPVDSRGIIFRWNLMENTLEQDDIFFQAGDALEAAAATGGSAFANSNAIDKDVAEIVAAGSYYYTVSYTPTNAHWDGGFRRLQVRFAGSVTSTGVPTAKLHLEYRDGYYAQETGARAGTLSPGRATRRLISYSPLGEPAGAATLSDAMSFGAVAPFEVLFQAHITPQPAIEKIKRETQAPAGNFLSAQWLHEPYRNYGIHYSVNPEDLQLLTHGDGVYRDTIEFVAILYDGYGHVLNSFINTVPLEVNAADYVEIQKTGLGIEVPMAVPVNGDYTLRLGVHDLNSGRVGALEIPTSEIRLTPGNMAANPAKPN
jgi:VWFA-related protein